MIPGTRVTLKVTFEVTAPFGTMSFTPFGIDTLPPLGPITALDVACETDLVQSSPVTAVEEIVEVKLWLDDVGAADIDPSGDVGASPHAVARIIRAVAARLTKATT
jgi:hypothetical protein